MSALCQKQTLGFALFNHFVGAGVSCITGKFAGLSPHGTRPAGWLKSKKPSSRKKLDRAAGSRRARTVDRNDGTNVAAATVGIGNHRNAIHWVRSNRSLRGQAIGAD